MAVKMNLRIITKRIAADPEIGFLTKSISKADGYGTAMPPAWELKLLSSIRLEVNLSKRDISSFIRYVKFRTRLGL